MLAPLEPLIYLSIYHLSSMLKVVRVVAQIVESRFTIDRLCF